jgi:translation initiation factor IF-2
LKEGEVVAVGQNMGRVKAMFNYAGKRIKRAPPSTPVEVLGLSIAPQVGDIMTVVDDEKSAQALIEKRRFESEKENAAKNVSLSNVYDQISAGKVRELGIILKADVQGSIEPIKNSLEKVSTENVKVSIIHSGTGNITESDIMLAIASKAVVIGFNVGTEPGAKIQSEREGISIRNYSIIYNMVEDVEKALKGMLAPTLIEVIDGHAEIRAVFTAGKKEKAAGVMVTDGKATRGGGVRVMRKGKKIYESTVSSLRRFKDDVREVATGYECGVGVEGFNDYQIGDVLEFFHNEKSG